MVMSKFNVVLPDGDGAIIFNARSGGVLGLNAEYYSKFKQLERGETDCLDDLIEQLRRGDMVTEDGCDEMADILVQSHIARFSTDALSLTIAPTMGCSFRCPYCYEKGREYTTMSDEVAEQIIAFVGKEAPHLSSLSVEWYGGEPLLCLDRIQSLTVGLKGVLSKDCTYSAVMVTNGYFLTSDVAETLKNCDVQQVQVTIDGSKKDHDSRRIPANGSPTYELILQNVEDCADIINISIRVIDERMLLAKASHNVEKSLGHA